MNLDSSVVGLSGEVFIFDVEFRHIRQFADAIGDPNPLYSDKAYAEQTKYGSVIAPPTFSVAFSGEGAELPIKLDERRMLHGEQEFINYRPIKLGDRLYCQRNISDLYEKEGKSGKMQFLVVDTEMKDEGGQMVAVNRMNIIYRGEKS
ncbi:MaoC family dehydratase N-terminal domain-containing protein [Oceanobacillus bengalensis]|uniref:MaoC family dehydratase n=1 Tax=Oceanobacillus bengalensis TaxID=1435466 RepID=A0A494YT43_9BACI|nr:MaoC family dehydratase N-terminal domain-containing protein [Oceanobacillus bengalensis]RKQ13301.1 MaoC family dehydratase [Oceanobacillus bengalensis]